MGRDFSELPVEQVLRQAAQGDASAWRVLVYRYTPRVYGLLVNQCHDKELAEELTQATFVKVVKKLNHRGGYKETGRFEAWLFRIAMNGLRDEMRRRKRQAVPTDMGPSAASGKDEQTGGWAQSQQAVIAGGPAPAQDPADVLIRHEQVQHLRAAIQKLSQADQQIIHLRHAAGLSFAQIAETLGQPLGTVLSRGHRALNKLKKMMMEYEQGQIGNADPDSAPAGHTA
ncbi:MAG: sigma-70 family RNA polymerase sigma factor [Phycisphaeraceae bacterium]